MASQIKQWSIQVISNEDAQLSVFDSMVKDLHEEGGFWKPWQDFHLATLLIWTIEQKQDQQNRWETLLDIKTVRCPSKALWSVKGKSEHEINQWSPYR